MGVKGMALAAWEKCKIKVNMKKGGNSTKNTG